MPNVQYGLKEVANVIFFDITTNKPVLFFDTLKVSTIENESDSAEARGGQGNGRLMSWDFARKATLKMQDALLSDQSLAMLSGNALQTSNIKVVGRELLTAVAASPAKVTLSNAPNSGTVTVFKTVNGVMDTEVTTFTVSGNDVNFSSGVSVGDVLMVFYEYNAPANSTQITFSSDKFPATYKVVGDTIVRGRDGVDRKMQFVIPKAKLKSGFNLTMDVDNVATFDFELDVYSVAGTNELYHIVRL